jgi:hypothetical protein
VQARGALRASTSMLFGACALTAATLLARLRPREK